MNLKYLFKVKLDIIKQQLKQHFNLKNLDDLPPPDVLQQEIIEHLEAALSAFRDVAAALPTSAVEVVKSA